MEPPGVEICITLRHQASICEFHKDLSGLTSASASPSVPIFFLSKGSLKESARNPQLRNRILQVAAQSK